MSKSASTSVANKVRRLAASHNVSDIRDDTSRMAMVITQLAGDSVVLDSTEQLLVNLKKKGVLTKAQTLSLQADYLLEKRKASGKFRA